MSGEDAGERCLRPYHRDEAVEVCWVAFEAEKIERTVRNWCAQFGIVVAISQGVGGRSVALLWPCFSTETPLPSVPILRVNDTNLWRRTTIVLGLGICSSCQNLSAAYVGNLGKVRKRRKRRQSRRTKYFQST
jgi:hypothetical protein